MTIKIITISNNQYNVKITVSDKSKNVCLTLTLWNYRTQRSWGHKGTIWGHYGDNYVENHESKIVYYNRTYECYTFQRLIYALISKSGLNLNEKQKTQLLKQIDKKARAFSL